MDPTATPTVSSYLAAPPALCPEAEARLLYGLMIHGLQPLDTPTLRELAAGLGIDVGRVTSREGLMVAVRRRLWVTRVGRLTEMRREEERRLAEARGETKGGEAA